ncbi:MAG: SLBB domain-containing protein, partial [Ignavibacteriales bacterium]|nr:SLBB domain-containing protein [Ignavibacteriales bacterium]
MNRRLLFVKILLLISFTTLKSQISLNDVAGSNASSMMALQQISVTIGGEFIVNGSFPASATERVDQFITRTYNTYYAAILTAIKDENSAIVFRKKYEKFALRNIELIHKDGRKEVVDLANFRLTGDFSQNPYIKEGDLIIFPTLDLETNFISVTGAVNKELEFQFVEGDDLQTALFFARGINTAYKNVNKAIISRLEDNGQKEVEIEVNLNSDTKLKSGDRIRVIFDERNNFNYRVLVIGEVNRPGYIPISRNSTTLKEVITKAGGFTENASLKFSELIREYDSYSALRKKSIEESYNNSNSIIELNSRIMRIKMIDELKMMRNANLQIRDTIFFNIDNSLRLLDNNYRLNFSELNNDSSYTSSFKINDGDIIVVPQQTNEVFV